MIRYLENKRFGKLVVHYPLSGKQRFWLCSCDCGNMTSVTTNRLVSGKTKSCGCHRAYAGLTSRRGKRTPERVMFINVRSRAKNRGHEFSLDFEDIVIPEICPFLGIPLKKGEKVISPNSPSLDRIDSTRGYVKGNVRVISMKANAMKQNATLEEFETMARNWRQL